MPPIATITHFNSGNIDTEFLRARVSNILEKNKFLTGYLTRKQGLVFVEYNEDCVVNESCINNHWEVVTFRENPFQNLTSYLQLREFLDSYMVKCATNCLIEHEDKFTKDKVLFKVVVFDYDGGSSLLVTLNHLLGDGQSYYRIFNMLNQNLPDEELFSMIFHRSPSIPDIMNEYFGKSTIATINHWSRPLSLLLQFAFNPKTSIGVFIINPEYIQQKKAELQGIDYFPLFWFFQDLKYNTLSVIYC